MFWDSHTNAPTFAPTDVITDYGWTNPETGEVHVFISGLQATANSLSHIRGVNIAGNMDGKVQANITYEYFTGQNIVVRVVFKQKVFVTGTPQLALSINGTPKQANFSQYRGAGNVLEFVYTLVGGDSAAAGQLTLTSPITLNGGTIKFADASNATLTFTAPDTSYIAINDASGPTATGATIASNGSDSINPETGDVITVTVTYNKVVNVTGLPQVVLNMTSGNQNAVYVPTATAHNKLKFSYTVQSGDSATATNFTTGTAVVLNGGTIKDPEGNAATSTFSAPTTSTWAINKASFVSTVAVTSNNVTPTHPVTGNIVKLTLTFDRPVVVVAPPQVQLNITSGNKQLVYNLADSTSTALAFEYTVLVGDIAAGTGVSVSSPIVLNGGSIKDFQTGVNATLTFTPPTMTTWAIN